MESLKKETAMLFKKATFLKSLLFLVFIFLPTITSGSSEFEKWKQQEMGSYQEYRDERDKAFTKYLKEQWKEFKVFQGEKPFKKPKPVKLPVAKPKPPEKVIPFKGKVIKKIPSKPIPEKPEVKPVKIVLPPAAKKGKRIQFDFFGTSTVISYDPKLRSKLENPINKNSISAYWDAMSKPDYESLIKQVNHYKKELKLNDWGYHLFLYRVGEKIYGSSERETTMFVWFMLTKTGYESKIGYSNSSVYLLVPTKNKLFSVPYLTLKGNRYYALSFDGRAKKLGSLYTYKGKYPGASDLMNYSINNTPRIKKELSSRNLKFTYRGKSYNVPVKYDKSVVKFFKFYPQTNFEVYFDASTSPEAGNSLIKALKPLVEGKTEGEAVNTILRFVQTAFEYKTDDGQFGREKYLLPDETLFYPYSDCEDRSILFAFLVKNLTGHKVVALHYPNHIATAVKFNSNIKGDSIIFKGQKYLISDPTYINADIGMVMPKFKGVKPKIIPLSASL